MPIAVEESSPKHAETARYHSSIPLAVASGEMNSEISEGFQASKRYYSALERWPEKYWENPNYDYSDFYKSLGEDIAREINGYRELALFRYPVQAMLYELVKFQSTFRTLLSRSRVVHRSENDEAIDAFNGKLDEELQYDFNYVSAGHTFEPEDMLRTAGADIVQRMFKHKLKYDNSVGNTLSESHAAKRPGQKGRAAAYETRAIGNLKKLQALSQKRALRDVFQNWSKWKESSILERQLVKFQQLFDEAASENKDFLQTFKSIITDEQWANFEKQRRDQPEKQKKMTYRQIIVFAIVAAVGIETLRTFTETQFKSDTEFNKKYPILEAYLKTLRISVESLQSFFREVLDTGKISDNGFDLEI